jgi:O-antigen ligase
VGVANYGDGRRRFAKEDPKLPAHSNYLQIGAEMGLLGLFAFLWIAIGGVLSSFWIFRGSPNEEIKLLGLGFLGLWIWFLVQSQFATYYDSTKFSMLFWLLAGLNMSLYRTNSRNS